MVNMAHIKWELDQKKSWFIFTSNGADKSDKYHTEMHLESTTEYLEKLIECDLLQIYEP